MRRDDQKEKTYFRSSERIFRMNEAWYFSSREGDQGPWRTEGDAQRECARYIEEKTELSHFQQAREAEQEEIAKEAATPVTKLEILPLNEKVETLAESPQLSVLR